MTRAMTNRTTKIRAKNLAMSADVLLRPPKPRAAAMIAMIAKVMAQRSMSGLLRSEGIAGSNPEPTRTRGQALDERSRVPTPLVRCGTFEGRQPLPERARDGTGHFTSLRRDL